MSVATDNVNWEAVQRGAPTYSLANRVYRLAWRLTWLLLASWTPPFWTPWRLFLLRLFGAKVSAKAFVRGSARIWMPSNLVLHDYSSVGPSVEIYNVASVTLHPYAVVSQRAFLCTAGHDVDLDDFPLTYAPIAVEAAGWIAAEAFVGPGVTVGQNAVLGARGVAFTSLEPNGIYVGNPCALRRHRRSGPHHHG